MLTALAITVLLQPKLSFSNGSFIVTDGQDRLTVPLSAAEAPRTLSGDRLNMRLGETLITFDHRGLGIQYGSKGGFTTLAYMATSPKLFSTDEIKKNSELAAVGERTARVSALSGFEVVKDRLYLLLRWDDSAGAPWLEILVTVDTSGDAPKVDLIGRFEGYAFAKGTVSDELYSRDDLLFSMVKGQDGLAVGTCDTKKGTLATNKVGPVVDSCVRTGGQFYTVTQTAYGMKSIGVVSMAPERFRTVLETRGEIVPSSLDSTLVVREPSGSSLFSITSGARLPLPSDYGVAPTPYGVLVWSPRAKPAQAAIREPAAWASVADWKSTGR